MTATDALTTVLHRIRAKKPEAQVAEETGIAPAQLRKYRSGHARPHVDEWPKIVRSVHEVDPSGAAIMAQAAIPPELFYVTPVASHPSPLVREVLESGAAYGRVSRAYLSAVEDGRLDPHELDEIEAAYMQLNDEAAEGLAAIERERKTRPEQEL